MSVPRFTTAVPVRRYSISDFDFTVLSEIESQDERKFHFILAAVPLGQTEPLLFLSAEPVAEGGPNTLRMMAYNRDDQRPVGDSDHWRSVDGFCKDAVPVAQKLLGLEDAEPMQVM